jgi:hypothetical protein
MAWTAVPGFDYLTTCDRSRHHVRNNNLSQDEIFWGLLWSDEHKTASHCLGLGHDCNGGAGSGVTVLPAHARILGFEITINTVYNKPLIGIQVRSRTAEQRGREYYCTYSTNVFKNQSLEQSSSPGAADFHHEPQYWVGVDLSAYNVPPFLVGP